MNVIAETKIGVFRFCKRLLLYNELLTFLIIEISQNNQFYAINSLTYKNSTVFTLKKDKAPLIRN
jgi:hypothetical protein